MPVGLAGAVLVIGLLFLGPFAYVVWRNVDLGTDLGGVIWDADTGVIVGVNAAWCRQTRYTRAEAVGTGMKALGTYDRLKTEAMAHARGEGWRPIRTFSWRLANLGKRYFEQNAGLPEVVLRIPCIFEAGRVAARAAHTTLPPRPARAR